MAVAQGAWRGYSHTAGQQRLMRGDLLPCSRTPATSSPHARPVPRLTPPLLASPESDTQEGETAQDGTVSSHNCQFRHTLPVTQANPVRDRWRCARCEYQQVGFAGDRPEASQVFFFFACLKQRFYTFPFCV